MAQETFFQNWIFKDYAFPLILVFALVFAVLEKTKVLGDGKKQLNALVAIIVSMILVGVFYPKQVISNLVLFMAVSLVVIFVFLILYGFVVGDKDGFKLDGPIRKILVVIVFVAVVMAVIWATGTRIAIIDLLFRQEWSETLWTNVILILSVVGVLYLVFKKAK
jgi:O-antigen ligase